MYPPPPSFSSAPPKQVAGGGLIRYGSAPGSFLTGAVDSVVRADRELSAPGSSASRSVVGHQYISVDSSSVTSESTSKVNSCSDQNAQPKRRLQRSYGLNEIAHGAGSLVRQKSSPAGFPSHLTAENWFSITRGSPGHSPPNGSSGDHVVPGLSSQLSFTGQDSLSQISEVSENCVLKASVVTIAIRTPFILIPLLALELRLGTIPIPLYSLDLRANV